MAGVPGTWPHQIFNLFLEATARCKILLHFTSLYKLTFRLTKTSIYKQMPTMYSFTVAHQNHLHLLHSSVQKEELE